MAEPDARANDRASAMSGMAMFRSGFLTNVLNPKNDIVCRQYIDANSATAYAVGRAIRIWLVHVAGASAVVFDAGTVFLTAGIARTDTEASVAGR